MRRQLQILLSLISTKFTAYQTNERSLACFCRESLSVKYHSDEHDAPPTFLVVSTRSVETTNAMNQNMQICHSLRLFRRRQRMCN